MDLRPAIATVSLGRSSAGHLLLDKIKQARLHGFEGVEIFYECLEHYAQALPGGLSDSNLIIAAQHTRKCCDDNNVEVICLLPFIFYDGLTDTDEHEKAIERLQLWFKLASILRTDLIQVPTNFLQGRTTGDMDRITADCLEIAKLGMKQDPIIRFAYEAVAWGNHIDTWDGSCEIVKRVNMPNFGICLDTFHIAGRVYADPTAISGKNAAADDRLDESLALMERELDVSKIFYLQLGDAQLLDPPLSESHPMFVPGQPPRMTWSRNARLFAYETGRGAYLPIDKVVDVIVNKLGYRGWVSMETFSHELFVKDRQVPEEYAERGRISFETFLGRTNGN